ncbi:hypothetical protein L195_g050688 [Trifolium pratense]|uniref:Uncharacterized protein n=1 Tax=Trifolium pratense TaxID=57577 RepID=A0A2K3JVG2_TRIPR|nr:hypothetical protein L195_g050688 [Trifolium pratense]
MPPSVQRESEISSKERWKARYATTSGTEGVREYVYAPDCVYAPVPAYNNNLIFSTMEYRTIEGGF